MTGRLIHRPGLEKAIEILRAGDIWVVWRLDGLGRSLKERIEFVPRFYDEGFSLCEIADVLHIRPGSVKAHLFSAIRKLRELLTLYFAEG